jgi:hypothetical protein
MPQLLHGQLRRSRKRRPLMLDQDLSQLSSIQEIHPVENHQAHFGEEIQGNWLIVLICIKDSVEKLKNLINY